MFVTGLFSIVLLSTTFCNGYDFKNNMFSRRIAFNTDIPDKEPVNIAQDVETNYSRQNRELENNTNNKYYQDKYFHQFGPKQMEFGHISESPHEWEQRFERIDHDKNRRQGQVIWGNVDGKYGEQYWDFNHAGKEKDDSEENSDIVDSKGEDVEPHSLINRRLFP